MTVDSTALAIISPIVLALAGAVKVLWARVDRANERSLAAHAACEKDRDCIWDKLNALSVRVEVCPKADCPVRTLQRPPHTTATGAQPGQITLNPEAA